MAAQRGMKWLKGAEYISDEKREEIISVANRCKDFCRELQAEGDERITGEFDPKFVTIAPACYTGEPHPYATITYGIGQRIFENVY